MIISNDEMPPIRVPPDRIYTAEVVVLVTSLGVKRREFNASSRVRDMLEIIRAHHKVIDFNLDTNIDSPAKIANPSNRVNQADLEIVRRLYKANKIRQDKNEGVITLPQVLIDGINIGDGIELQSLHDQDLLEGILKRSICPKCLRARSNEFKCKLCDASYEELMPGRQTIDELLSTFESDDE